MKSDAELSLAVARIMWPEYEWETWPDCAMGFQDLDGDNRCMADFDHTTDDALGKMYRYAATMTNITALRLILVFNKNDEHRELAEAIVEAHNEQS